MNITIHGRESGALAILRLCSSDHGHLTWLLLYLLLLHTSPPATAQAPNTFSPPPSDPLSGLRFDKSMAIIMVILVVVFFILGFLSVYTRQCAERQIRGRFDLTIPIGGSGRRSRGLDPEIIDAFPTFVYSTVKGLKIGRGTLECAVCLNEFQDDETLRLIPKCNHVFHPHCIDTWLASHFTCPVCRANLVPTPGEVSFVAIQIPDAGAESDEPERRPGFEENPNRETIRVDDNRSTVAESSKLDLLYRSRTTNQNGPQRSTSTGFRIGIGNLLTRSHSTGHSLVQPGENCERFTLRLPEEVRNQLLNSSLNRSKSCVTFTRMSSERRGYRTKSVGSGRGGSVSSNLQHERLGGEGRSERWGFRFFSSGGSARSGKGSTVEGSDRSGVAMDNVGERSTDRLCPAGRSEDQIDEN